MTKLTLISKGRDTHFPPLLVNVTHCLYKKQNGTSVAGTERDFAQKPYTPKHHVQIITIPNSYVKKTKVLTHLCVQTNIKNLFRTNFCISSAFLYLRSPLF